VSTIPQVGSATRNIALRQKTARALMLEHLRLDGIVLFLRRVGYGQILVGSEMKIALMYLGDSVRAREPLRVVGLAGPTTRLRISISSSASGTVFGIGEEFMSASQ
jgi:hypothetical protein